MRAKQAALGREIRRSSDCVRYLDRWLRGTVARTTTGIWPPPANSAPAIVDPLGRETPRSTMMGLLKYVARQDFATAARYLQLPPGQNINLAADQGISGVALEVQRRCRFVER